MLTSAIWTRSIDQILFDDALHVADHLALAASCRTLRSCYYTRAPGPSSGRPSAFPSLIWGALLAHRPFTGLGSTWWRKDDEDVVVPEDGDRVIRHLWTREDRVEVDKMAVLQKGVVVRGYEWEVAASRVAKQVRCPSLAGP